MNNFLIFFVAFIVCRETGYCLMLDNFTKGIFSKMKASKNFGFHKGRRAASTKSLGMLIYAYLGDFR